MTIAAAAPPQSASDWEMKGTSRMARGWLDCPASAVPSMTTTANSTLQARTLSAPHHRAAGRLTATAMSVDSNDEQDQHQQNDDDHCRRNNDPGLATGERLIDLTCLRGKLRQLLSLE